MQNPQTYYPPKHETFSAIFPAMPIHLQIPKFWSCKSARCHQGTHHPNNPPQQRGSVLHPQLSGHHYQHLSPAYPPPNVYPRNLFGFEVFFEVGRLRTKGLQMHHSLL